MNIYHIERTDETGYDEYQQFVIIADDIDTCDKLISELEPDEFEWPKNGIKYTMIGTSNEIKPRRVVSHYKLG